MFSLAKLSNSPAQPVYFDIRLKSPYKNVVLIHGTPLEAPPIPISGHLVFSIPESISVKKISLKLVGTFKLEFLQVGQHKNSSLASVVKERRTIFECVWDNLLVSSEGLITIGGPGSSATGSSDATQDTASSALSSTSLNNLWKPIKKSNSSISHSLPTNGASCTPYDGIDASPGQSFVIREGNYELPFKVSLPPYTSETIEGLQAGSVLYKFEAHMERGSFKNSFTKHKYLRIFRTLSPNNLAVGEEMSVGKSWPDRLQYEISIPSRAIPIGGVTPVTVNLYPFQKGYRLSKIDANLIQYYAFKDQSGQLYDDESVVLHQGITTFDNLPGCDTSRDNLITDKVELNSSLKFPQNLKQVTQDCDIGGDAIRVRHKLSIKIFLKRKIGTEDKSTEVKANIPVFLYVSPHVPLEGRLVLLDNAGKIHFRSGDGVRLFEKQQHNTQSAINSSISLNNLQRLEDGSLAVSYFPQEDTEAPPTYAKHMYDQLYSGNDDSTNQAADLLRSGASTPDGTHPLMRATTESHLMLEDLVEPMQDLSLEKLNCLPSYDQVGDDAEDEAALPVSELTPSYDNTGSALPSGHVSPQPISVTGRRPGHVFHGGLAHFVRSHSRNQDSPSVSGPSSGVAPGSTSGSASRLLHETSPLH
ncbi:LANO_0H17920g1_1 [Lachancea nothofagi CBS 11611]|uniref:LANO_0H17920g1_1 n=1 Tax=Lachancea nothofagi CBS 11611 TaxID=1266666 RepID=A0A1G4KN57_9SACH|nr:LANO_0H17920g1_1 [Lachancea nothofagi CBS 11611]